MSQAQIIDGKITAERLRAEVAQEVAALKAQHGLHPGLAVVLAHLDCTFAWDQTGSRTEYDERKG